MAFDVIVLPSAVTPLMSAKNAPSIRIADLFAALRLRFTLDKSDLLRPDSRYSDNDQTLDCAPESASPLTEVDVDGSRSGVMLSLARGWSLRRARFHSPLVKM